MMNLAGFSAIYMRRYLRFVPVSFTSDEYRALHFHKKSHLLLNKNPLYGILSSPSRRSSVVEHTLGKGEVESPILSGGTIFSLYKFI